MPNLIQRAFSALTGGLWQRSGGSGWGRTRLLLVGSRFNYEQEAGDLWGNPVVGLCLDWLGNRFPRPLIRVSTIADRKGDGHNPGDHVPVGPHALTDLWNRPNPYYGRRTLEKAVGLSLKVDGNAYIAKVRPKRGGEPVELWWLPHDRVFPDYPEDGSEYLSGYRVRINGDDRFVPADDIIHIRDGIDPRNDRLGLCALRSCIREVCTINEESSYRAAILRNSAVPSLAVIPDADGARINQADADTIRDAIWEKTGGENRGKAIVMGGRVKIEKIGFSPEELNLVEFPTIPTARILSALGVAPMSLGLPDPGKTYSNLGEANRTSWGTIIATQELIAETLRYQLLPEFGDDPARTVVEYDYGQISELQEDQAALWDRVTKAWTASLITQNESRDFLGMDPEPDGDRYYPGGADPAEVARNEAEDELYAGAASKQGEDGSAGNGKPRKNPAKAGRTEARSNGKAKRWEY
jgi:HK97 family phage portal protein